MSVFAAIPSLLLATCALSSHAQSGVSEQTRVQLHGLDPALRDTTANPCENFFQYACGTWLKRYPIPADRSSYGVDTQLSEDNDLVLKAILEKASDASATRDADTQKIGDFYATCMDTAAIERTGLQPLQPLLDRIAQLRTLHELPALMASLDQAGMATLFDFSSDEDYKDASHMIAQVSQPRLGLPERGYYLRTDAASVKLRQQYLDHIARTFTLAGESEANAKQDADRVLALETKLATASLSPVELRDPGKLYHPTDLARFRTQLSNFDVNQYTSALQTPSFTSLNVATPAYFDALNTTLQQSELPAIQALLRWDVLRSTPGIALPAALDNESFDFYGKTLSGQPEQRERWKRCVSATDHALPEALGRVYVAQRFSPEDKARNLEIVQNIEAAMGRDIQKLDWMSPATKAQAEDKLHAVTNKVGYPDRWRDYSKLEIVRGDAIGNTERAGGFELRHELNKIGKPTDKLEWSMSPPTVNAYYDPQANTTNFPAGILQPPYYDPHMGDAVNYGQAGGLEGHELTHGFDDEGRQFDGKGNFHQWWTAQDEQKFRQRADCVADEYSRFTAVDDLHVNGRLTLGENIADIGGVRLGYLAWKHKLEQGAKPDADLAGMTPDQQFFTAYAQSWCSHTRPEETRVRVQTDPHSPEEYRVNGVVMNMPEFQQAFQCKPGQAMAPQQRCSIW